MDVENNSLEEFFTHCPELFFIADPQGTLQRLSEPLQRLLGPEARGTPLSAYVHPEDRGAFDGGWSRLGQST